MLDLVAPALIGCGPVGILALVPMSLGSSHQRNADALIFDFGLTCFSLTPAVSGALGCSRVDRRIPLASHPLAEA